jgi:pimeloyl-ACP methyl ester carboxylesterase
MNADSLWPEVKKVKRPVPTIVEGAGHVPWIENSELVIKSIDTFLNGNWPHRAIKLN